MKNMSNQGWNKILLGLGLLVISSGFYFIIQRNYLEGIAGCLVGLLLIVQNMNVIKDQNNK